MKGSQRADVDWFGKPEQPVNQLDAKCKPLHLKVSTCEFSLISICFIWYLWRYFFLLKRSFLSLQSLCSFSWTYCLIQGWYCRMLITLWGWRVKPNQTWMVMSFTLENVACVDLPSFSIVLWFLCFDFTIPSQNVFNLISITVGV